MHVLVDSYIGSVVHAWILSMHSYTYYNNPFKGIIILYILLHVRFDVLMVMWCVHVAVKNIFRIHIAIRLSCLCSIGTELLIFLLLLLLSVYHARIQLHIYTCRFIVIFSLNSHFSIKLHRLWTWRPQYQVWIQNFFARGKGLGR